MWNVLEATIDTTTTHDHCCLLLFGTQSSVKPSRKRPSTATAATFLLKCIPCKPTTTHNSHLAAFPCLHLGGNRLNARRGVGQSPCCSAAQPEAAIPYGCLRDWPQSCLLLRSINLSRLHGSCGIDQRNAQRTPRAIRSSCCELGEGKLFGLDVNLLAVGQRTPLPFRLYTATPTQYWGPCHNPLLRILLPWSFSLCASA